MQKLAKLHQVIVKQLGRDPTDEEWASGAGVELSILRRRLALGRAARTKLIQVWSSSSTNLFNFGIMTCHYECRWDVFWWWLVFLLYERC